jgi:hypothetical protein
MPVALVTEPAQSRISERALRSSFPSAVPQHAKRAFRSGFASAVPRYAGGIATHIPVSCYKCD